MAWISSDDHIGSGREPAYSVPEEHRDDPIRKNEVWDDEVEDPIAVEVAEDQTGGTTLAGECGDRPKAPVSVARQDGDDTGIGGDHEVEYPVPIEIGECQGNWLRPGGDVGPWPEAPSPVAAKDGDGGILEIGHGKIQLAVPVEVTDGDRSGIEPSREVERRCKRTRRAQRCRVQKDRDGVGVGIRHHDVESAVSVDVADRKGAGTIPGGKAGHRTEATAPVTEQNAKTIAEVVCRQEIEFAVPVKIRKGN